MADGQVWRGNRKQNKIGIMALDGEESTPVPNLALEAIVKPTLREVMLQLCFLFESRFTEAELNMTLTYTNVRLIYLCPIHTNMFSETGFNWMEIRKKEMKNFFPFDFFIRNS